MSGEKRPREITGRHVLVTMVAFFLVVVAVDAFMIFKAVSTFGGIENKTAYKTGLAYNQRIAEEKQQDALGWVETLNYDKAAGALELVLKDRDGRGVGDLAVSALIGRPATNAYDREVALNGSGDGRYLVPLPDLADGTWSVSIVARDKSPDGAIVYRSKARLWKQS